MDILRSPPLEQKPGRVEIVGWREGGETVKICCPDQLIHRMDSWMSFCRNILFDSYHSFNRWMDWSVFTLKCLWKHTITVIYSIPCNRTSHTPKDYVRFWWQHCVYRKQNVLLLVLGLFLFLILKIDVIIMLFCVNLNPLKIVHAFHLFWACNPLLIYTFFDALNQPILSIRPLDLCIRNQPFFMFTSFLLY